MKIAYIIIKGWTLGGGIEKYTEELGERLVKKGHEVVVYALPFYGAKNGSYRGMRVQVIPALKIRGIEKLIGIFLASLRECFKKNKQNIIHCHAFSTSALGLLPRLFGIKTVVQGHGIEWRRSRWGVLGKSSLKLFEYPSVKLPSAVSVVSRVQQDYLFKTYGINSEYIPTGVNPPVTAEPDLIKQWGLKGGDYVLFAARLVREKGAHYLIEAFRQLSTSYKLVIAGGSSYEERYKSELCTLAQGDSRIIFAGHVDGKLKDELFTNCYLFVLPSEVEGLSIALLEAMSYGNCCLASDIPENLEAVRTFGYSFKSKDVKDLKTKLEFLISNPEKVSEIKAGASQHVLQNYSWDSIADEWENFYQKVLRT
jgi:glycosyltransferase involved in cell wall biosynthesis